jgi:hypothetical protein
MTVGSSHSNLYEDGSILGSDAVRCSNAQKFQGIVFAPSSELMMEAAEDSQRHSYIGC